ncbi:hypothetical protein, partial [uncultured Ruminococcus sp.]|uniref:hypothetical protein n=1 Tax=uncultured Ruminococcus sp. TaxID=165186 RepID=UPI0025F0918A
LAYIFPPPQAGERYTTLNYPFVHRIFSWCAKGIVIKNNIPIWLCIVPPPKEGKNTKEQPFCIISNTHQNWEKTIYGYL